MILSALAMLLVDEQRECAVLTRIWEDCAFFLSRKKSCSVDESLITTDGYLFFPDPSCVQVLQNKAKSQS